MDNVKAALAWVYAGGMAVLTAIAEEANWIEPNRLVWLLGFAGAAFGVALLPSARLWQSAVKLAMGWIIAGAASTPLVASHAAPAFVTVPLAALWLGFAGPALFLASVQGNAIAGRLIKGKTA